MLGECLEKSPSAHLNYWQNPRDFLSQRNHHLNCRPERLLPFGAIMTHRLENGLEADEHLMISLDVRLKFASTIRPFILLDGPYGLNPQRKGFLISKTSNSGHTSIHSFTYFFPTFSFAHFEDQAERNVHSSERLFWSPFRVYHHNTTKVSG